MKVQITREHIDKGFKAAQQGLSRTQTCAISQVFIEMYPGKNVSTGMCVIITNGETKKFKLSEAAIKFIDQFDEWVDYRIDPPYPGRVPVRKPRPRTIEVTETEIKEPSWWTQ